MDDCTIDAICAGTPQTCNRVYLIGRKGYHPPITIPASIIEPDLEVVLDPREPGDNQDNVPWGADGDEIATTRKVRRERERLEAKLKRRYDPKFDIKKTERVFDVDGGKKNTYEPADKHLPKEERRIKSQDYAHSNARIPCLTASQKYGLWLMSRGRRMRAREALKAEGVRHQEYRWSRLESELFCMAGNAMNLNVVVRIFEVLLPHLGFQVPSPGDYVLQKDFEPVKVNQSLIS